MPDFFPASLQQSRSRPVTIDAASAYDRSLVPKIYYIDRQTARIPLSAANGCELVITESADLHFHPSNVQLEIPRKLVEQEWSFAHILRVMHALVSAMKPDHALITDERRFGAGASPLDIDISKVPRQMYWVNYYGPTWVANLGSRVTEAIERCAHVVDHIAGGVVFAVAARPLRADASEDLRILADFETAVGLAEVHKRYPNRGVR